MGTNTAQGKLSFMRRMLWWLPVLVFAVWSAVLAAVSVQAGAMSMMDAVIQALIVAAVVGIVVAGAYFGYKFMLEKNPSL